MPDRSNTGAAANRIVRAPSRSRHQVVHSAQRSNTTAVVAKNQGTGSPVPVRPRRDAQRVHRHHGVLVTGHRGRRTRRDIGQPPACQLLGTVEGGNVGVALHGTLTLLGEPRSARARSLLQRAEATMAPVMTSIAMRCRSGSRTSASYVAAGGIVRSWCDVDATRSRNASWRWPTIDAAWARSACWCRSSSPSSPARWRSTSRTRSARATTCLPRTRSRRRTPSRSRRPDSHG